MSASPYRTTEYPAPSGRPGGGDRPSGGSPKAGGNWGKAVLGVGCGCSSVVALLVFLFLAWVTMLPTSGARPGGQLREVTVDFLNDNGLLEAGESVVYYYDYTLSMDNSESCFFTDLKVTYQLDGVANSIAWTDVDDIDSWEDWGEVIEVRSRDGRYLRCDVPALNEGQAFHDAMVETWERHRTDD